jgi:hypothetical protein
MVGGKRQGQLVCWKLKKKRKCTAGRGGNSNNVGHAKELFGSPEIQMNPLPPLVATILVDSNGFLRDHRPPPPHSQAAQLSTVSQENTREIVTTTLVVHECEST